MAGKVKTWVWVVVAIVIVGILGIVAMAGLGFYFFSRNIETRAASPANAAQQFEEVKTKFSGQKPLVELDERGRFLKSNPDRPKPAGSEPPHELSVMAFDPDDGRIVRVKIPFWLLRLRMQHSTIDFNGGRMDLEDLKLTIEDLESFGPTLIVDHTTSDGSRVLVWSQ